MAQVISVASGKGGVGKSVVSANLALVLAQKGKQVVLVDLDVGGADAHVLVGLLNPPRTLTDFLNHRIEQLDDLAHPLPIHPNLRIIPGTGDTLATANMAYAQKKRLIRNFQDIRRRYRSRSKLSYTRFFSDGRLSRRSRNPGPYLRPGSLPVHQTSSDSSGPVDVRDAGCFGRRSCEP